MMISFIEASSLWLSPSCILPRMTGEEIRGLAVFLLPRPL
jgi:hypothetical protein